MACCVAEQAQQDAIRLALWSSSAAAVFSQLLCYFLFAFAALIDLNFLVLFLAADVGQGLVVGDFDSRNLLSSALCF